MLAAFFAVGRGGCLVKCGELLYGGEVPARAGEAAAAAAAGKRRDEIVMRLVVYSRGSG